MEEKIKNFRNCWFWQDRTRVKTKIEKFYDKNLKSPVLKKYLTMIVGGSPLYID